MSDYRAVQGMLLTLLACLAVAAPADAQWAVASNDGKAALNLGFLAQTQVEVLQSPGAQGYAQNLFIRRARLMLGGRVDEHTSFFIDTDVPNLGKGQASGAKVSNTIVLQDLVLTRTCGPGVKVDAGMLYVPLSHNSQQAVGSLLAVDYGSYSFLESDATDSKLGRDYGLDGRTYFANRHAELRIGVYQGARGKSATGPFRTAIRAVYYPFEPDTGFFYSGTAFGKKRVLALGSSYDAQSSYYAWDGDVSVDLPVRQDCATLQVDYLRYDGRTTFVSLPRQDVVLVELGYYLHRVRVTPYVQYAARDYRDPALADDAKMQAGLAFWGQGHRSSLKLGVAKLTRDKAPNGAQYVVQWQVLAF